ncbi:uncharacterized protein RSE6_10686 [Rhynchosporium secalis]|uniref:Uncharacterized protein n=1 Tax=Rhynchosporium secalis TaxID=38038 RepID=A0A1E1MM37_RHYSE|nr:uncharacterized protein RSE6_10686 [Rhynchosporium secalis]
METRLPMGENIQSMKSPRAAKFRCRKSFLWLTCQPVTFGRVEQQVTLEAVAGYSRPIKCLD